MPNMPPGCLASSFSPLAVTSSLSSGLTGICTLRMIKTKIKNQSNNAHPKKILLKIFFQEAASGECWRSCSWQGLKLPKICSFEIYENMRQGLKPPRGEDVPQYLNTSLNYKNSYKEIVNYEGIVGCKIVTRWIKRSFQAFIYRKQPLQTGPPEGSGANGWTTSVSTFYRFIFANVLYIYKHFHVNTYYNLLGTSTVC